MPDVTGSAKPTDACIPTELASGLAENNALQDLFHSPGKRSTPHCSGDGPDGELEDLLPPLPPGGLAERAAALLGRLYGACYADPAAMALDLNWVESQGFLAQVDPTEDAAPRPWQPVEPPPRPDAMPRPAGGLSRLADRDAFARVFTLLRHLLHHPFDSATDSGVGVCEHLARTLNALRQQAHPPSTRPQSKGPWTWRQVHAALTDT